MESTKEDTPQSIGEQPSNPKASPNRRRWLVGCCLPPFLLIAAAAGIVVYQLVNKPLNDFAKEVEVLALESPTVRELLGEPLQIDSPVTISRKKGTYEVAVMIKGSVHSGKIIGIGKISDLVTSSGKSKSEIVRESMHLELDGELIDLNPDEELTPDIQIDFGE